MSETSVTLDDEILLRLYTKFQGTRRAIGQLYAPVPFDDFISRGRYQGIAALPASVLAQEHILHATNTLNRYGYDLQNLEAWCNVFETITEDEKMIALFEFVFHIASDSLSAPYAIKQLLVKSIYEITYYTSRVFDSTWTSSTFKPQARFDDARKLAQGLASWPALRAALSELNDAQFITASDSYRHRLNHGFPRRIELGHTMVVENTTVPGQTASGLSLSIKQEAPLMIEGLLPILSTQYEAAVRAYRAYIDLVKEHEQTWLSAKIT
jgi:hypothetical protein